MVTVVCRFAGEDANRSESTLVAPSAPVLSSVVETDTGSAVEAVVVMVVCDVPVG